MQHRTRDLLMRQRTQVINALRAHLAELGIVAAQGDKGVKELLALVTDKEDTRLPIDARASVIVLAAQLEATQTVIGAIEKRIKMQHRSNEASQRVETIPGIGVIGATAIAATVADPTVFRSGRDFAAWIGLVPRQDWTGAAHLIPYGFRWESVVGVMSTSIFLVGADNQLMELHRTDYGSEDVFQKILADHPAMLCAAAGTKGKLLLVRREQPVPDHAEGAERWSLDHLFLDGDGVPVLVEVKQASDTRARREVVAQMLDYAANGVAYWPIDRIAAAHRETAIALGRDPDAELSTFLDGGEAEAFWRQVDSNLRSGRIRMLFVADRIPKELARIVEFMNEQMRPAEVLAIEVEHFLGANGMRTLVPRLVGATARAQTAKSIAAPAEPVSEEEWLVNLAERRGESALQGAERAIAWFRESGFQVEPTKSQDALVMQIARADGKPAWPFFIRRSTGRLDTALGNLMNVPVFKADSARKEILDRIRSLPADSVKATDKLNGWPSVALEEILKDEVWAAFRSLASDIKAAIETGETQSA
jgi:hypothetical protein